MNPTYGAPTCAGGHAAAIDVCVAKFTFRRVHSNHARNSSITLSTSSLIKRRLCIRVDSKEGWTSSEESENVSVKRSEIVELLSTVVNTLMLPENLDRLKKRLQHSGRTSSVTDEAPCQPQITEEDPSTASEDNDSILQVISAGGSCEQERSLIGVGKVTMELHPGRNSEESAQTYIEKHCSSPQSLPQVSVSGISGESDHAETGKGEIQRMSSTRGGEVISENTDLTSIRKLKTLDVHSYVHDALRQSFLRSHLRSRKIEE
ncbi:hypothetical protein R1sor_002748 [Riccia sorocarpa]|uniref:Uncharacterized protein n=1 Tax=Riccia sorocarpa TaxID=122646 RepID=A0ABD3H1B7_9MARC